MTASKFAASALIALASVAATSAFAGNDNNYPQLSVTSTKSRADVQAELAQARQDGSLLSFNNDKQYPKIDAASTKTRAEVRAEYEAALKAGEIVRIRS
ncbi:hypothetical protein J2X19_004562 [Rhodoferax ferrireducens]|uniref:DUF4148 domain-containing protein n=1 Tax=Rhodoferax ferrireducens TaxID=192843 RepID=A0ABU2CF08_9BURK|nr:DUF4148 domain-containing protein [Rhodoferax ferrireducens]MDR7379866.1 hypothetical protein [Rhodoferax ferrireducens]